MIFNAMEKLYVMRNMILELDSNFYNFPSRGELVMNFQR